MKELEERILSEGRVLPGGVLKVDGFLNHRIDTALLYDMALEIGRLFEGCGVNKVLTVEASGIALASMAGFVMGCPMVFAKKSRTSNIAADVYTAQVASFTHGNVNTLMVSKSWLSAEDRVLIIDDFLATGAALIGLRDICAQAGAEVVGAAISIEKVFQGGGNRLRAEGMRIESLAKIASMTDSSLEFC
ncbi:MAG: xanthine phosphoribosyltransferase [Oscillospiraceae bacterium]|nr:xanthine phosphoribosyltransferase [Oscillospiraceae bacterium]